MQEIATLVFIAGILVVIGAMFHAMSRIGDNPQPQMMMGIKTSATTASDGAWNHAHREVSSLTRMAARMFWLAAALTLGFGFTTRPEVGAGAGIALMMLLLLIFGLTATVFAHRSAREFTERNEP